MPQVETTQPLYIIMTAALIVLFAVTSYLLTKFIKDNEANDKAISVKMDKAIDLLQNMQIDLARQDKDIFYLKEMQVELGKRLNLHGKRLGRLELSVHGDKKEDEERDD